MIEYNIHSEERFSKHHIFAFTNISLMTNTLKLYKMIMEQKQN